jgi:hypothetical protein
MRSTLSWIGLGIIVAGITFLVIADIFWGFGGVDGSRIVTLVTATALLVVIGGGALGSYWGHGTMLLQHIAIWLGLIALFALVYSYREFLGFDCS